MTDTKDLYAEKWKALIWGGKLLATSCYKYKQTTNKRSRLGCVQYQADLLILVYLVVLPAIFMFSHRCYSRGRQYFVTSSQDVCCFDVTWAV